MSKKIMTLGLILLSIAAFSGCGGEEANPLNAQSAQVVLGQLQGALNKLPQNNTVPSLPITGVTTAGGPTVQAADCETVSPTTTVDADGDSIALEKTSTFDCTEFTSGNNRLTRKGTVTTRDSNDSVAGVLGGFRVEFAVPTFISVDTSTGLEYSYSYEGFWNYEMSGNTVVSTSDFSGLNTYTYNQLENDYTYRYTWDWRLTPDDSSNTWTTGRIEFSGTFRLNGRFVSEDSDGNHTQGEGSYVISYYSRDLVYDSTCTKFYRSGSYFVDDGNGTSIEIRYNCTTAKLYVGGVESDWYTP